MPDELEELIGTLTPEEKTLLRSELQKLLPQEPARPKYKPGFRVATPEEAEAATAVLDKPSPLEIPLIEWKKRNSWEAIMGPAFEEMHKAQKKASDTSSALNPLRLAMGEHTLGEARDAAGAQLSALSKTVAPIFAPISHVLEDAFGNPAQEARGATLGAEVDRLARLVVRAPVDIPVGAAQELTEVPGIKQGLEAVVGPEGRQAVGELLPFAFGEVTRLGFAGLEKIGGARVAELTARDVSKLKYAAQPPEILGPPLPPHMGEELGPAGIPRGPLTPDVPSEYKPIAGYLPYNGPMTPEGPYGPQVKETGTATPPTFQTVATVPEVPSEFKPVAGYLPYNGPATPEGPHGPQVVERGTATQRPLRESPAFQEQMRQQAEAARPGFPEVTDPESPWFSPQSAEPATMEESYLRQQSTGAPGQIEMEKKLATLGEKKKTGDDLSKRDVEKIIKAAEQSKIDATRPAPKAPSPEDVAWWNEPRQPRQAQTAPAAPQKPSAAPTAPKAPEVIPPAAVAPEAVPEAVEDAGGPTTFRAAQHPQAGRYGVEPVAPAPEPTLGTAKSSLEQVSKKLDVKFEEGQSSGVQGTTANAPKPRGTLGKPKRVRAATAAAQAKMGAILNSISDKLPYFRDVLNARMEGRDPTGAGGRALLRDLDPTEIQTLWEKMRAEIPDVTPEDLHYALTGKTRISEAFKEAVPEPFKTPEAPQVSTPSKPSILATEDTSPLAHEVEPSKPVVVRKATLGKPKAVEAPPSPPPASGQAPAAPSAPDVPASVAPKPYVRTANDMGGATLLRNYARLMVDKLAETDPNYRKDMKSSILRFEYDTEQALKKGRITEDQIRAALNEAYAQEDAPRESGGSSFKQGGSLRRGGSQSGSVYIPGGGEFVEVAGRALDYVRSLGERVSSEARELLSLDHVWPRVEEFDAWLGAEDRRQKYMNATPEEANRRFDRIARGVPAASDVPFIPSGPLNENFPDTVRVWAGHGGRVVIGTVRGEPGSISATTRGEAAPKVWYHMLVPDREGVLQYEGKYTSLRQARTAAEIGIKTGKTPNSFTHPLLKDVRYQGDERYYENGWSGAVDRAAMVADVKARMGGRRMGRNFGSESGQIINPADAVVKGVKSVGDAAAWSVKSIADTIYDLGEAGQELARRLTEVKTQSAYSEADWSHRIWQPGWDALSPKAKDFLRKHGTEAIDNPDMPMPADAAEFINTRRKLMKINAGENLFIEDKSGLRRSHMLPERHVDHVLTDEAAARYEAQDPATMERWRQMNPGRRFPLDEMAETPNRYTSDYLKPTNRNALPREYNWPNEDLEQNLEKLDKSYMRRMAQYQAEMKHLGYSDLMEGGDVSSQGEYGKLLAKIKDTHGAEAAENVKIMMRNALGRGDRGDWNPGAKAGKTIVDVVNQGVATYYLAGNIKAGVNNLISGGLSADAFLRHPKVPLQILAELAKNGPIEVYRSGVDSGAIPEMMRDYSHVEVTNAIEALGKAGRIIHDVSYFPLSAANTVLRTMLYAGSEAKLEGLARDLRAGGSARQGALHQLGTEMRLFPEEIDRIEKGEHTQHDLNKFQQQWIKHTSGTATLEERPNWMHSRNPLLRVLANLRGSSAMTANRTLRGPLMEARNGRPARLILTFTGAIAGSYALDKAWQQMFGKDPRDKDIKDLEEIVALHDAGYTKQSGNEALKWLTDQIQKSWFMGQLGGTAASVSRASQEVKGEGWEYARKLANAVASIVQMRGSRDMISWPPPGVRDIQMFMKEQERKKAVLGAAK